MKIKQKTHKGASKRFKITATGKILHRSQNFRHNINKKSKGQVRRLKLLKAVEGTFSKKIKKLLALQ